MEDLEHIFNSNNPIIIAQIFSKLITNIKEKQKVETKDCAELMCLKSKCMVSDPLTSDVAAVALIDLVKDGILPIDTTLADFITSIPLSKCHKCLVDIIGNLLYLEAAAKAGSETKYASNYNLWLPQHPYITILNENPDSWKYVLNEIEILHEHSEIVMEIFRPVFLYALCNPAPNDKNILKQNTWNFILNRQMLNAKIFYDILGLLQVETENNLDVNSNLLSEVIFQNVRSDEPICNIELLILWQISFLHNLALNKLDLRPCISCLKCVLQDVKDLATINCMILILAKTITICSPVYLSELLCLCKTLLCFDGKEVYILDSLKCSLLQWLASPTILTVEANKIAKFMLMYIENYNFSEDKNLNFINFINQHRRLICTNKILFVSMEICFLLQHLKELNNVLWWIQRIGEGPDSLVIDVYHLLCGLFVSKKLEPEVVNKVLSLILKCIRFYKPLSTEVLTLILYKLSNTIESVLHFALLKALPQMVVLRDNIPKVVATLLALSEGSEDLYNFSLSLMFDAWKIDNKCYAHLESMLIRQKYSEKKWESYITKAFILKELCERRPELYGRDMVAHLSKILNECNDDDGALPCAIAIEGIGALCKSEIIDVVTTWGTLAPKFKNDRRTPVIESLCSLIHEIPSLPYTESYVELQEEVIKTLWDYVNIGDSKVTAAALNGLTSFSLEQISSQLPEQYLDEDSVQERQRSVAGIPLTVPGKTWVKFLIDNGASQEAGDFIIKMISTEVEGYLKYVYQVKGHREPINYDYLPTHSVVRGIGEFVKTWANKWKHSIHDLLYIECLRILSREYTKPLPPLDWCFLQELLYDSRIKHYCIDLASHQAILSGTARRLMDNYIMAVTENLNEDDIMNVSKNLKHLGNSIQPIILKPFLENMLAFCVGKFETGSKDLLKKIVEHIIEFLKNTSIQDTNKTTIAQVLSDKISILEIDSELFDELLKCIILLPKKCIDELTNLKSDGSENWLEKIAKIRCWIACNTNLAPLIWLNDIIEASSKIKRNNYIISELVLVFRKHINNPSECALWLLELIGQIQAKVAERSDEGELLYFFDVFILSVIEFSGFSMFITDDRVDNAVAKEYFPQAFNTLLSTNDWSVCTPQALEWLFHMNAEETIPQEYRNIFGITLWSLRHDEEFIKNLRWMKYLSSRVTLFIQ